MSQMEPSPRGGGSPDPRGGGGGGDWEPDPGHFLVFVAVIAVIVQNLWLATQIALLLGALTLGVFLIRRFPRTVLLGAAIVLLGWAAFRFGPRAAASVRLILDMRDGEVCGVLEAPGLGWWRKTWESPSTCWYPPPAEPPPPPPPESVFTATLHCRLGELSCQFDAVYTDGEALTASVSCGDVPFSIDIPDGVLALQPVQLDLGAVAVSLPPEGFANCPEATLCVSPDAVTVEAVCGSVSRSVTVPIDDAFVARNLGGPIERIKVLKSRADLFVRFRFEIPGGLSCADHL